MKYPRFRVATCEGYHIKGMGLTRRHSTDKVGLSATVCDTFYNWRTVKTYRSEDRVFRRGRNERRGREGALRDAEDHALYLNHQHSRELHREWVRKARAKAHEYG